MAVMKRSPKADTESGESYVGQRIAKDFDGDIFYGTVSKYFPKDRLWKIDYDDGDKEELELEELLFALDLHMEKTKKKRKRAKKGGGTSSGADDVSIAAVKRQVSLEKPLTTKSQSPDAAAKYRINGNVDTKDFPGRVFGMTNRPIKVDILKFARNRCRVQGGHTEHPSKFPGRYESKTSFAYLMQRLSDRNYCMRALCIDGSGAEYTTYKGSANVSTAPVTWFPATSLNDHSDDDTVVDACHLDLINPSNGFSLLTGENLRSAIKMSGGSVECIFINGSVSNEQGPSISADDITSAITMCKASAVCIGLTECNLSASVLDAIASCPKLRGLIIEHCKVIIDGDNTPTDSNMAKIIRSCPHLRWCLVKSRVFGEASWCALAEKGACPDLEVLWIESRASAIREVPSFRRTETGFCLEDTIRLILREREGTLKISKILPNHRTLISKFDDVETLSGQKRPLPSRTHMI